MRKFSLLLALTMIFVSSAYSEEPAETRPCEVNYSATGSQWSQRSFKSFQEYPNSSKSATFTYLLQKIYSMGYTITSQDKDVGLINGTYNKHHQRQNNYLFLKIVLSERTPTGVRVDLTLTGPPGNWLILDDQNHINYVRHAFCSILD